MSLECVGVIRKVSMALGEHGLEPFCRLVVVDLQARGSSRAFFERRNDLSARTRLYLLDTANNQVAREKQHASMCTQVPRGSHVPTVPRS
ncbi:uncharacterized protein CIMG_12886 [Coccidioides immitis RS]|uniref:Uncharacterized protein n=1 Tax=Coccidioides immitis (strain RS) TaxID=246410 RepID=A0A0D8JT91_COCIM|nr:uncharacterized protein CIMG_12886 [Coccidioides immitis RS]KJF60339.1 hypothetical protein CIMG_12886 [Coccidioides immitis RS]